MNASGQTVGDRYGFFSAIKQGDTVVIDSLSIAPGSVSGSIWEAGDASVLLAGEDIKIDYASGKATWLRSADSAAVNYRAYPFAIAERRFLRDARVLDSVDILIRPIEQPGITSDGWPELDGLDYNGSFSRGLSFGNKQDVVLNSSLNLQLAGKLRDDIEINAAITDNNIPVQPDGNTAQLQEFDRVYISLAKDEQRLIVGDLQLNSPDPYFLNFFKRLQGGSYTGAFRTSQQQTKAGKLEVGASAAVAKGQYRKQQLQVEEGNQGPYKLNGNNGERFIIIVAGTERVFVDGRQLSRGTENDYVIDYNAGEITFMPRLLVTKDIRIFIEFQYSDQNYFRSMVYGHGAYTTANNRLRVAVDVYSEQDGKNQSIDQDLGNAEKSLLAEIGDSLAQAFIPGVDSVAFDPDRILYRKTDSLGFADIFVYSIDPDLAKFQLSFSEVGQGLGNYVLLNTVANGRVYAWVAPVAGQPQGNFEPVRLLVAPEKTQMLTAGLAYKTGQDGFISAEVGMSQRDENTFSNLDDADDSGVGLKLGLRQQLLKFGGMDSAKRAGPWRLMLEGSYEFVDERFNPVERYRTVEFERDWNIFGVAVDKRDEHIASGGLSLVQGNGNAFGYNYGTFRRAGNYKGNRQQAFARYSEGGFRIDASASLLDALTDSTNSKFFRPKADISQEMGRQGWKIGIKGELEDNQFSGPTDDSLRAAAFYYDQWGVYLESPDSSEISNTFQYIRRRDRRVKTGEFALASISDNFSMNGAWRSKRNQRLGWSFSYRQLEVADTAIAIADAEESILGRLEYGGSIKRGLIRTDLVYQLGSGQELRREYTYLQVPAGEGNYSWVDYNENGIAELDEFEQAAFTDQANYIRVLVPSNDFIRANLLQFSYSLGVNPASIWYNEKGIKKGLSRFALQSSWQLNRKLLDGAGTATWLPTDFAAPDTSLVSLTSFFRQSLFFNRGQSKFGLEYSWQSSESRTIITNGAEDRLRREHILTTRWAPGGKFFTRTVFKVGKQELISGAFLNRNYSLPFYELNPELSYQEGTKLRLSIDYRYKSSTNDLSTELLSLGEIGVEGRYKLVSKSSLEGSFSWVEANYNGEADSPVGFAMLEGLQAGTNYLWSITYDRKVSRYVQLSLQYEGRKTGLASLNHIGRAQLRAIF